MSEERRARIEELAWRNHARAMRPRLLTTLPGGQSAPVTFLDFMQTTEHSSAFREAAALAPSELVDGLEDCWPKLAGLWGADERVVVLPDLENVGALALPFGYISENRAILLARGKGALYVADGDLRRGFAFLAGETDNEFRRWGTSAADPPGER
jgi:hypothetical protein